MPNSSNTSPVATPWIGNQLLAITRDLSVTVVGAGWMLLIVWMLITAIRRIVNVRAGRDVALT